MTVIGEIDLKEQLPYSEVAFLPSAVVLVASSPLDSSQLSLGVSTRYPQWV